MIDLAKVASSVRGSVCGLYIPRPAAHNAAPGAAADSKKALEVNPISGPAR